MQLIVDAYFYNDWKEKSLVGDRTHAVKDSSLSLAFS